MGCYLYFGLLQDSEFWCSQCWCGFWYGCVCGWCCWGCRDEGGFNQYTSVFWTCEVLDAAKLALHVGCAHRCIHMHETANE